MREPLAILKMLQDRPTDLLTNTARCRVACPLLKIRAHFIPWKLRIPSLYQGYYIWYNQFILVLSKTLRNKECTNALHRHWKAEIFWSCSGFETNRSLLPNLGWIFKIHAIRGNESCHRRKCENSATSSMFFFYFIAIQKKKRVVERLCHMEMLRVLP